jgi:hypothetical protein
MATAGETVMALKFPPIKKSHIVTLLTILLSLLGGGTTMHLLEDDDAPATTIASPCPAPAATLPIERPSSTELAPAGGAPSTH